MVQGYAKLETLHRRVFFAQPLAARRHRVTDAFIRRAKRSKHLVLNALENKPPQRLDRLAKRAVDEG